MISQHKNTLDTGRQRYVLQSLKYTKSTNCNLDSLCNVDIFHHLQQISTSLQLKGPSLVLVFLVYVTKAHCTVLEHVSVLHQPRNRLQTTQCLERLFNFFLLSTPVDVVDRCRRGLHVFVVALVLRLLPLLGASENVERILTSRVHFQYPIDAILYICWCYRTKQKYKNTGE